MAQFRSTTVAKSLDVYDFSKVKECSCTESWSCGEWHACINGQQLRTCADTNNCGTVISQPLLTQPCVVQQCKENWNNCSEWSPCANGQQSRTCYDSAACGTDANKPVVSKGCTAQQCSENWSCSEWNNCSNGAQTRTCTDTSACNTDANKPVLSKACRQVQDACNENWSCLDWSACANNSQTRICTDSNNCGTTLKKPVVSKGCRETNPAVPFIQGKLASVVKQAKNSLIAVENGGSATTELAVIIQGEKFLVKTANGQKQIVISPSSASLTALNSEIADEIILADQSGIAVYKIFKTKEAKLLFFIPVTINIVATVDAETGNLISIEQPWWSFLAAIES